MNFKGRKGMSNGQSKEHQRNWSENGWREALASGNFDRAREHLNFEIVGGKIVPVDKTKSIGQRLAENLAARGIKDPNEGLDEPKFRTVGDFLFTGTHERMTEMAFGDQPVVIEKGNNLSNLDIKRCPEIEQWAMDIYNFVAGKYGEQNIVSFYVHLDETTPHAHVAVVPVNEKGRISFKQVFAGENKNEFKQRLRQLHSDLAVVNKRWGLQRGTSLTEESSRHYQPREFRRRMEDDSREKELDLAETEEQLSAARHNLKLAERRMKGLLTMISRQEEKKASLEKELKELQRRMRNNEGDNKALEEQMAEVQKKLRDTEERLADKRGKLAVAAGSDLKWGRDEDEDDRRWRRRCVSMACHLMRRPQRVRKR